MFKKPWKTSVRMAGGRVRTYHLPNAKPTLFRSSDIVTGMQLICSSSRLVFLDKTGKELSFKSQAFNICIGESRPAPSLKAPSQHPVRYTHQVSPVTVSDLTLTPSPISQVSIEKCNHFPNNIEMLTLKLGCKTVCSFVEIYFHSFDILNLNPAILKKMGYFDTFTSIQWYEIQSNCLTSNLQHGRMNYRVSKVILSSLYTLN